MEKREPSHIAGRNVNWCSHYENSVEFPQKIKSRTTIWPSNFTTEYWSEEYENTNSKRYLHRYVHDSIIYNSQDMETT